MNFPKYRAGPVEYWLAEAGTVFVNGFISGLGGGSIAAAGSGVAASSAGLWSGADWMTQVLIVVFGATVAALGQAFKAVIVWHHSNAFPNPWPKPTGNTPPPFAPQ
jgi:hypothetical protein